MEKKENGCTWSNNLELKRKIINLIFEFFIIFPSLSTQGSTTEALSYSPCKLRTESTSKTEISGGSRSLQQIRENPQTWEQSFNSLIAAHSIVYKAGTQIKYFKKSSKSRAPSDYPTASYLHTIIALSLDGHITERGLENQ